MSHVDFSILVDEAAGMFREIYAGRNISCSVRIASPFIFRMNEQLAVILVRNLLKNAVLHSAPGSSVSVEMNTGGFSVSNPGETPLDRDKIFTRFYHSQSSSHGSTGLGLAIADSICRSYSLALSYAFNDGMHVFSVRKQW